MSREGYHEESSPLDTERPSAAAEIAAARRYDKSEKDLSGEPRPTEVGEEDIDEGREDFETRLDSSRSSFAAAEYAYKRALKEAGVSRRERRRLDGEGEALTGREFPHLLDRYRNAKATYEENKLLSQRERVEGGPNRQEGMAQALEFRLEEKRHLQNVQYEARPKKERGLLWRTGAAVFRGFQALNKKINSLPPKARWAANVARWGAAGAIGGAGVVFAAPAVASLLGISVAAGGVSAGAAIGMRVGRSIFGGFTGTLAADLADRVAEKYMNFRGLTREQLQKEIETVSRTYEEEGNIDVLEKFLAEKGTELEERYARMERDQKIAGYGKIAAAIIGGGVGGYFGYERLRFGQLFSGEPAAAQTPVPQRAPGPGQADPRTAPSPSPEPSPMSKSSFDKLIVDRARVGEAQGVENSFAKQIHADPKSFGFEKDLEIYKKKGSAWTKAATPEAMQEEWAKWKAHRLALETGVVQKGKQLLVLDQTPLGRKNASYVLTMEGGNPKVTVVLEDDKGGYKAGASFTPDHKWDGKPLEGYEYASEPDKPSAKAQQTTENSRGRVDKQKVLPEKLKTGNVFTVKEGDHEFKITFRTNNVEQLLREQGIRFDKERGDFDLSKTSAGGVKFVSLEFSGHEHGGVRTQSVEVYGHKVSGEVHIIIHNSDHSLERIVMREGQIVSHTRNGESIQTPIEGLEQSWDSKKLAPQVAESWGPETASRPEGASPTDAFGNQWRVVEANPGTDRVLYETEITALPDSLNGSLPKGVELVAVTDSPGGPYQYFGLYDAPEGTAGRPLILRIRAEDIARFPNDTARLEYAVHAARARVAFIDAFTERNDWDRAVTVNLVKDLEMGRSSRIFMDFAKPDNVIPERIIFEVAPSRNGILLSMPMPDHRSPFSGQHFQSVAAERIEDLMDLSKKAGALASVRDQARILYETIQSYNFDQKWDDVMKLNLRTIEIQAQEWQSRSDPSTWYTSKSQGAFAGWLLEQAEALKRQGVKLTPQTKVGTILDAIARDRA